MKSISLSVIESDYEAFRRAAEDSGRSIAQLIREAMALYREERIDRGTPLREVPVLAGHRLKRPLPSRVELYDEMYGADDAEAR